MRLTVAALFGLCVPLSAQEWPQWRGPNGDGTSKAVNVPSKWSESTATWKCKLPHKGWSSPVIEGDFIWMTAAVIKPASDEEKKKRLENNTGSQPLAVANEVSLRALCVNRKSGKLVADVELMTKKKPQPTHTMNGFASPSPIIRNGKLYCHFGSYGTACYDTKAKKVLWQNQDLVVAHENGPGSSPVLHGDQLIFHMDGSDKQFIAALDSRNGKVLWRTKRSGKMPENPQMKKAYGTPLITAINGKLVVVSPASNWVYGYDPETGKELWKLSYGQLGFSNVPRPVAGLDRVFISTSFMRAKILAIRFDKGKPTVDWAYKGNVPRVSSPLLVGGRLYFVTDSAGVLSCIDARTGKLNYRQRLGNNHSASPLYADGKIFFFDRSGETIVIEPGPKFRQLAKNKLDGSIMATPAVIDGAIFIRTDKALYCISNK